MLEINTVQVKVEEIVQVSILNKEVAAGAVYPSVSDLLQLCPLYL
jgi:hypothetical protein